MSIPERRYLTTKAAMLARGQAGTAGPGERHGRSGLIYREHG